MAKGKLFEYAVIYHPKETLNGEKEKTNGHKKSQLVSDVKRVLAESEQEVGILAARQIPDEYLDRLADIELVIRPF